MRQAREVRRAFVRDNWLVMLKLFLYLGVVFGAVTYWIWRVNGRSLGLFALGAACSGIGWCFWMLLEQDGSRHLRNGGLAEQWTSEAFKRLPGWYVIDDVKFDGFNVDHVMVGPAGVLAVETKYTSVPWRVTASGLLGPYRDPAMQARSNARKIRLLLKGDKIEVPVVPTIAVWGRGAPSMETGHSVMDGVLMLDGRDQEQWQAELETVRIDCGMIEAVRETLQRFVEKREAFERAASTRATQ